MERSGRGRAQVDAVSRSQGGRIIPEFELGIAATAIVYDLTLITCNRRHYGRITMLKLMDE
ncbi:MAG TPA: hypothetical protein VMM78_14995 [Thermomicrobiales bacterium]|nr:hypothetical protein [Thermomicrobiales bacterium]